MPFKKFTRERKEALYIAEHGNLLLPFKMPAKQPEKVARAVRSEMYKNGITHIGISIDPDGDSIWIRRV